MTNKFEIVPATRELALQLAPNLRHVDKVEIYEAAHHTPESALLLGLAEGDADMTWIALLKGEPVAMFGAGSHDPQDDAGYIWMLASDGIYKYRKAFMQRCAQYLEVMHTRYSVLFNYIHAENKITCRWLEWLGFTMGEPTNNYAVTGALFIPFVSIRS